MRSFVSCSLTVAVALAIGGCAKKPDANTCAKVTAHKAALLGGDGEVDEALAMLNQELLDAFKTDCEAGKFKPEVLTCVSKATTAEAAETCETAN